MSKESTRWEDSEEYIKRKLQVWAADLEDQLPKKHGFVLLVFPFGPEGMMQYVSNGRREDVLQALPELKGQGFEALLKGVVDTGKPFMADEVAAELMRKGQMETIYVNLTYQPRREGQSITGILVVATDVTEQVLARKKVEEKEVALQNALEQVRLSKEAAELGTFDMNMQSGDMHWDDRCRLLFGISHQQPVSYEKDFIE